MSRGKFQTGLTKVNFALGNFLRVWRRRARTLGTGASDLPSEPGPKPINCLVRIADNDR
jgi:hypothetical protein